MRASYVPGFLLALTGGFAANATAAPQYAPYDDGYGDPSAGQGQTVRCESSGSRISRCPIDTQQGVRLVRKLSNASCDQGRSWGYDRDGVWVTQGCRADFASGGGYGDTYGRAGGDTYGDAYSSSNRAYGSSGAGQVFRCESGDGRRRQCAVDTRGGIDLVRQLSSSACIRGQSWGWDDRGVWVDNGCRAEFRSGAGWSDLRQGNASGAQSLRCESSGGRYRQCPADVRGGVRLVRKLSSKSCIEGRTWGASRGGIWVDKGCRADFEVDMRDNNGWAWGRNRRDDSGGYADGNEVGGYIGGAGASAGSVRCESNDGRTQRCNVAVQGVRLQRQLSDAQCQQGQTWGWDRDGIWVSAGCRADFEVW